MKKEKHIKCKLKQCLCYGKSGRTGICDEPVPSMIKQLNPNSISCPFYSTSMEEDLEWLKKHGGIMNLIKVNKKDRNKRLKEVDDGDDI